RCDLSRCPRPTGGRVRSIPPDIAAPMPPVMIAAREGWGISGPMVIRAAAPGGKRLCGRKRHIVVDVRGLLLVVMGHAAGIQDRDGAKQVLTALVTRCPGLLLVWADGGDAGKLVTWVATVRQRPLVIGKRPRHTRGFQVVQWRWIVERTFGWLHRSRR